MRGALAYRGRVPNNSDDSLGKQAGRYRSVLSLANFSSSGRGEGKKVSARPRTAVQQTRKNEFPAGKQQNFPKSTFATSSWPPPFRPHLICLSIQRRPWLPAPDKPPTKDTLPPGRDTHPPRPPQPQGPEWVGSEGKVTREQLPP